MEDDKIVSGYSIQLIQKMQASLKLNTKNSEYILLTISNLEKDQQTIQDHPLQSDNYLDDSNITHSRITQSRYPQTHSDRVREDQIPAEDTLPQTECATCSHWKRWAIQQQKNMLSLEEQLLSRDLALRQTIDQLNSQLQTKAAAIQQYNQQLLSCQRQMVRLNEQVSQKQETIQSFIREKQNLSSLNVNAAYATPLKAETFSYRLEGEQLNSSTKVSQMLTDEKKGRTCTTATRQNLEWSAFETNFQKLSKENNSKTVKGSQADKYLFENTMLKEYNAVLLERLKESKYRKPF